MPILKRHIVYWVLSGGSLGLLGFEAPRGALLTSTPERGHVTKDGQSVRGRPVFIWAGGGYQGGK
jgi:hypothetical protein